MGRWKRRSLNGCKKLLMGDPARNDFFASKYFITAILFFTWMAQHLLVVKEHDHHLGRSVARRKRHNVSRTRTPFPSNAHSRWGYSFHNHFSCTKLPFASRLFSSPTQKSTHTHTLEHRSIHHGIIRPETFTTRTEFAKSTSRNQKKK